LGLLSLWAEDLLGPLFVRGSGSQYFKKAYAQRAQFLVKE
jgi:hypothetical protein